MLKMIVAGVVSFAIVLPAFAEDAFPTDGSNTLIVVQPPTPLYPWVAAETRTRAHCEVKFDVLAYGNKVEIVSLKCSHPWFCAESENGLYRAKFRVEDIVGTDTPGERHNIVYPLDYLLEHDEGSVRNLPIYDCPKDKSIS